MNVIARDFAMPSSTLPYPPEWKSWSASRSASNIPLRLILSVIGHWSEALHTMYLKHVRQPKSDTQMMPESTCYDTIMHKYCIMLAQVDWVDVTRGCADIICHGRAIAWIWGSCHQFGEPPKLMYLCMIEQGCQQRSVCMMSSITLINSHAGAQHFMPTRCTHGTRDNIHTSKDMTRANSNIILHDHAWMFGRLSLKPP